MGEPPAFLPDFFASEPSPRSWPNVGITVLGLLFCVYLLVQAAIEWIAEPIISEVEVASIAGDAYELTLVCKNQLGCIVEHLYADAACSESVAAASSSAAAVVALADGEELTGFMCHSPLWSDGLLITAPLGIVALQSPVEVLSGGTFVGLPPATLLSNLNSPPTAVGISLTTLTYINGTDKSLLGMASQLASSDSRCAQPSGGLGSLPTSIGSLCYQLRLEATATEITNVRAFTWLTLLDTWGGAYGFVFGLIGMGLFWLEQVSASICCPAKEEAAQPPEFNHKASAGSV